MPVLITPLLWTCLLCGRCLAVDAIHYSTMLCSAGFAWRCSALNCNVLAYWLYHAIHYLTLPCRRCIGHHAITLRYLTLPALQFCESLCLGDRCFAGCALRIFVMPFHAMVCCLYSAMHYITLPYRALTYWRYPAVQYSTMPCWCCIGHHAIALRCLASQALPCHVLRYPTVPCDTGFAWRCYALHCLDLLPLLYATLQCSPHHCCTWLCWQCSTLLSYGLRCSAGVTLCCDTLRYNAMRHWHCGALLCVALP